MKKSGTKKIKKSIDKHNPINIPENQKKSEAKNKQFADIVNNMQLGLHLYHLEDPADDRTLRMVAVNPPGAEIIGLREEDLLDKTLDENFPGLREKGIPQCYAEVVRTGKPIQFEDVVYGDQRVLEANFQVRAFPLPNHHVGVLFEDISQQKKAEQALRQSLKEKELLLKEIHHRVKNNLAMISSLLNIQSSYIKDEQAREAFTESRKRINSIALIHEKLYRSTDLTSIEFHLYVRDLTDTLVKSYSIPADLVDITIDIADIYLDIDVSIPLGLITTELVTNSLKYGFNDDRKLTLYIQLKTEGHHLCLTVADNGKGIPEDFDWRNTDTLGIQLVILLTGQLDGQVQLDRTQGTSFQVTFPKPEHTGIEKN